MGWREETQAEVKDRTSGNKFKLDEGTNVIRILPSYRAVQKDSYTKYKPFLEYLVHKNVGPKKSIVRCGKDVVTKEGECWLCDEIVERYAASGKQEKRAVAKTLAPAKQFFMNIARWDKKTDSLRGPLKFYVPGGDGATSLAVKLLGVISGMGTSKQVDHPKKGCNISITRTGTGQFDTRYGSPIPDDESSQVPKSILRKIEPWSTLIPGYDENTQRSLFYGEEVQAMSRRSKIQEEEDDDMPMKKKKKMKDEDEDVKKKKKKLKDEDEDEEEEDDDEDEDEDEDDEDDEDDEPKKKKKNKSKKSSDDDDDDEEEDEDEDDEDEDDEPKKKKKKKKSKSDDDEDDEDEDDDDDEEDEDDDEPKKKKGKRGRPAGSKNKKKKKAKDDDDDDDD